MGRREALALLVFGVLALAPQSALAAPADLDPSFDGDGLKQIDYGAFETAKDVALQPDGKIVVVGKGGENHFAVTRLNPDGSFDTSFGGDGAIAIFFSNNSEANAVALQPDGKIVVVGTSVGGEGGTICIARVNPNGTLDSGFGGAGTGQTTIDGGGDGEGGTGVAIQPDGKIVVAGYGGTNFDYLVARLLPSGGLDTAFNVRKFDFGSLEVAGDVALQPDGKIVLVGSTFAIDGLAVIVRLEEDGDLDKSFDGNGVKSFDLGQGTVANSVSLQPDGKLLIAGHTVDAATSEARSFVVRLGPGGSPDLSFDADGILLMNLAAGAEDVWAVAPERSGRIVLAGRVGVDWVVTRRNANGSADGTFNGGNPQLIAISDGTDTAYGVAIQKNGRIVVVGNVGSNTNLGLARLLGDPIASVPYARPGSATPMRIPLVVAYNQCTAPNSTHRPPRLSSPGGGGDPACNPPQRTSPRVRTSPDGRGSGFVRLRAIAGNPATPADEADVTVNATVTDVICVTVDPCAAGTDYPGVLILRLTTRLTDVASNFGNATLSDGPIDFPMNCTPTGGVAGASCSVSTSLDARIPGSAPEGRLSIYGLPAVQVLDAGVDTALNRACSVTCTIGDETAFLTGGMFTP